MGSLLAKPSVKRRTKRTRTLAPRNTRIAAVLIQDDARGSPRSRDCRRSPDCKLKRWAFADESEAITTEPQAFPLGALLCAPFAELAVHGASGCRERRRHDTSLNRAADGASIRERRISNERGRQLRRPIYRSHYPAAAVAVVGQHAAVPHQLYPPIFAKLEPFPEATRGVLDQWFQWPCLPRLSRTFGSNR
jgi:hypothetical protein